LGFRKKGKVSKDDKKQFGQDSVSDSAERKLFLFIDGKQGIVPATFVRGFLTCTGQNRL
jgi:hypothetical protein